MELLMGKFHQILTELSAHIFFFFFFFFILGQNLSKSQGILIKLGMCIDMKEIWFRIANVQVSSMFDSVICLRHYNGGVF